MTTESTTAPTPASSPLGALGVPGTHRELTEVNAVLDYLLEKFGPDAEQWIARLVEKEFERLETAMHAKLADEGALPSTPSTNTPPTNE